MLLRLLYITQCQRVKQYLSPRGHYFGNKAFLFIAHLHGVCINSARLTLAYFEHPQIQHWIICGSFVHPSNSYSWLCLGINIAVLLFLYFRARQFWWVFKSAWLFAVSHLGTHLRAPWWCNLGQVTLSLWMSGPLSTSTRGFIEMTSKVCFEYSGVLCSHLFHCVFSFSGGKKELLVAPQLIFKHKCFCLWSSSCFRKGSYFLGCERLDGLPHGFRAQLRGWQRLSGSEISENCDGNDPDCSWSTCLVCLLPTEWIMVLF